MPDLGSYLEQTTSVYKVSEGFSLAHEGRSLGGLEKVIWDTGSEINLISESLAKAAAPTSGMMPLTGPQWRVRRKRQPRSW